MFSSDTEDWNEERDDIVIHHTNQFRYDAGADSKCRLCAIPGSRTAECMYSSAEWDYYYCYRCRGWFKVFFRDDRVFIRVKSKNEIRFLTLMYTTRMEFLRASRRPAELVRDMKRFFGDGSSSNVIGR